MKLVDRMKLYEEFGYAPWEMLMNPETGTVDYAEIWSNDAPYWSEEFESIRDQFASLVLVEWDGTQQTWTTE